MNADDVAKRLKAAYALLMEPTTTREKFNHVSDLIRGLHPRLDEALGKSHQALSTIDKIADGDVISLSADHLPETTDEDKRRKKYLLFFIKSWKDLQSEVARVSAEMNNQGQAGQQASMWGRIFRGARGPLGAITIVAVGLVALQQTSVQVSITNNGCATLYPGGSIPSIPGFSLPKDPIKNGDTASMSIPPLTLNVDGSTQGALKLSALTYSFSFQLPNSVASVTFDGANLIGKQTQLQLKDQKLHSLVLTCR